MAKKKQPVAMTVKEIDQLVRDYMRDVGDTQWDVIICLTSHIQNVLWALPKKATVSRHRETVGAIAYMAGRITSIVAVGVMAEDDDA